MTSTARSYFTRMYRDDVDPWGFETSAYERRKYALTVATLPRSRYRSAYEPGCSIGVLSELLAGRCDQLLSSDIIPSALSRARTRLASEPHVRIEEHAIPDQWPSGPFDLVILSEIAYYFDQPDLARVMRSALGSVVRGAHIVGVHWRGTTDYPLGGEEAHRLIGDTDGLDAIVHHIEEEFVLDVWERQ